MTPADRGGADATILVVDDNEQNRFVAEGHLVAAGYEVVMAASGHEALALFQARPIDLVLLDVLMPGLDGFDTCRRLRALPGGPRTSILFLTALGDMGDHEAAIAAGGDDYLMKPIQRVELLVRVRSLLRLQRLQSELERSSDVIRAQRDALVRAEEHKRRLAAMIVHDLKSPLAAMLANGQYLLKEPLEGDDRDVVREMVAAAELMHRMVMDLLDVSRSADAAVAPKPVATDVRRLFEERVRAARTRAASSLHELQIEVAPDAQELELDPDLICRVLDNLLDNSLKYAPPPGPIRLEAAGDGAGFVVLRLRDRGPGVPEDQRQAIFDPYARLQRDTQAHARTSRGMGLAFCKLAVEAHGGRIWVEDNPPTGSVFCLRLPRSFPGQTPANHP